MIKKINNRPKIYIFGAGGNTSVIYNYVSKKYKIEGLVVNDVGVKIKDERLRNIKKISEENFIKKYDKVNVLISIGENYTRQKIFQKFAHKKFIFPNIVHDSVILDKNVKLGIGNIIMPNTIVNANSEIGNFCILNTSSIIEHDCLLDSYVSLSPGSIICGNSKIGEGSFIGAGSTIIHNIKIARWSVIGAGSMVNKNTNALTLYFGNPFRKIKKITRSFKVL